MTWRFFRAPLQRVLALARIASAVALLLIASLPAPASAQGLMVRIRIPAKPLSEALLDFAVQAHLSISESGLDFDGSASNPIEGTFPEDQALSRLLFNTGFTFDFVDRDTVRIRRIEFHPGTRVSLPPSETVIVTASKRTQAAQSLASSVAVVGARDLESSNARSSRDLTSEVAGLTATNLGPGENKIFVRGLTDSVLPGLSESVAGLYIDDSRISDDAPDPALRLIDVDRVEVLRGPQGTLYGAGSLTGLVRIITRKPVLDQFQMMLGTYAAETPDGGPSFGANGMINIPLVSNVLALRLVAYKDHVGGFVDDVRLGHSDTNRGGIGGGRAGLTFAPNDRWSVTANLVDQNGRFEDSQYYLRALGPFKRDNLLREPHADHFLLAGITVNGQLGFGELVSNTSFVDREFRNRFDASQSWTDLTGFAAGPSPFDYSRTIRGFTHETRLTSADNAHWKWLVGLFLSHRDEDFNSSLAGPDGTATPLLARSEIREDRANEAALFGEVTFDFSREWALTAGARVFHATRKTVADTAGPLANTPPHFSGTNSQSGVAPKLVLEWRPQAPLLFYASYTEGYRLGGLNVNGPPGATGEPESAFDSDTLRNYELGAKSDFFEGRLIANAALYYAAWKNVQTDQIAPDGAFFIENAGVVHDLGFELDVSVEPIPRLVLRGNFFWNNAQLSKTNPLLVSTEGSLPGAPNSSYGLSARYDLPVGSNANAFAAADFGYVGSSHLGFDEATPAMGGYQNLTARLGLAWNEWQLSVYGENLLGDDGNTFAFGNPFNTKSLQVTPLPPRTIGVALSWER